MKKLGFLFIALVGLTANSFGQTGSVSAGATATGTIVAPLAIAATVSSMNFGTLAVGTGGGNVVMTTTGSRTTTGDAQVVLNSTSAAAEYDVTGSGNLTYAIHLPLDNTVEVTHTNTINKMKVNTFTSDKPLNIGTLSGGNDHFKVGATLIVGGNQLAGVYTSGTFNVTIDYN